MEQSKDQVEEHHEKDGLVVVWDGDEIRTSLKIKHAETFWIRVESKEINNMEYFYLKSLLHTKEPLLNQFIPLIEEGVVTIDHLIKEKKTKKGKIIISEKGPLFKIKEKDLSLLFPKSVEYILT